MSKLSFRARALDAAKPLPIYRGKDMPDLNDCVSINRAVPQMPTGMEKEEESEHHLQRAISAQQVFREKKESMVIPVPEAESNVLYYSRLYKGEFKQPKQFIHIQREYLLCFVLACVYFFLPFLPFFLLIICLLIIEPVWVSNRKNDEASYEKMLKLRREFSRAITILEMIKKREKTKRELLHLTLEVVEKRYHLGDFGGEILNEIKIPKVEKDIHPIPASLHNGNHHKVPECKAKITHHPSVKEEVLEIIRLKKKYPKKPKPDNFITPQIQPASEPLPVINKSDIKQYDFQSSDEEEFPQVPSPVSEPEEENDPDGPYAFRRRPGCQYYAPRLDQTSDSSENTDFSGLARHRYRHCLTTLTVPRRCIGFARRRIGRGGRVIMDRLSTEHDPVLKQLDPELLSSFSSSSQAAQLPSLFSWTNASDKHCEKRLSLFEILSNIKSYRLQCFQPRPPHFQDSDSEECTSRILGQAVNSKRVSATPVALLNTSKNGISGGITEEQFQTHQQQLVQMQRQQLAQLQQKQQSQQSWQQTHLKAQGLGNSDCMSKTLDSASAQFAASAVVNTPTLGRSEVTKDQNVSHGSLNGVVQPSGAAKTLFSTNMALSSSPGISTVQLVRTVGHPTTNHLIPTLCTSNPQTLPMSNSCLTNTVHLNNVSVVSPVNVHISTRTSAPSPTALKLATVAASMDRVPKVTPSSAISSIARENHEPERLGLNGIAETTVAMEVT
ncbi:enhancer of polycomb homolog 2 [Bombina bombina]|uniref:enhancer of polycomb homolog 2 n=1 Tax=Bombina bombina TaxID=8345 RepID=UPI00235A7811|nr:enhancer of polycomb homolog 2 [Bombina bombina]